MDCWTPDDFYDSEQPTEARQQPVVAAIPPGSFAPAAAAGAPPSAAGSTRPVASGHPEDHRGSVTADACKAAGTDEFGGILEKHEGGRESTKTVIEGWMARPAYLARDEIRIPTNISAWVGPANTDVAMDARMKTSTPEAIDRPTHVC